MRSLAVTEPGLPESEVLALRQEQEPLRSLAVTEPGLPEVLALRQEQESLVASPS